MPQGDRFQRWPLQAFQGLLWKTHDDLLSLIVLTIVWQTQGTVQQQERSLQGWTPYSQRAKKLSLQAREGEPATGNARLPGRERTGRSRNSPTGAPSPADASRATTGLRYTLAHPWWDHPGGVTNCSKQNQMGREKGTKDQEQVEGTQRRSPEDRRTDGSWECDTPSSGANSSTASTCFSRGGD